MKLFLNSSHFYEKHIEESESIAMKGSKKKRRILLRFLLSYFLILLIPVFVLSFTYREFVKTMEYFSMKSNLSMLEQTRDTLDKRLGEIDSVITQIALNSKVRKLMYVKDSPSNHITSINEVSKELLPFALSNKFIYNFYVYFKNSNIILSPYTSYIEPQILYGQLFKYDNIDFKQFSEKILNTYHYKEYSSAIQITMNKSEQNMIVYMQSIPYEFSKDFQGNMLFFINESEIHKLLNGLAIEDGGWAYITDQNGKVIISYSKDNSKISILDLNSSESSGFMERNIDGEKMVISHTSSLYNGWTYVAALPHHMVMTKLGNVRKVILDIIILTLVISLLAAYWLAYNNSKPFKEIIKVLKEASGNSNDKTANEYDFLKGSIARLIENNTKLKQAMDVQIPMLQAAFLDRLFKGDFKDVSEMKAVLAQTQLYIKGSKYTVVLIRVHGYNGIATEEILKEMYMRRVAANEVLNSILGKQYVSCNVDFDKISLIAGFDINDFNSFTDNLEICTAQMRNNLLDKYGVKVSFSAGGICDDLISVYHSFDEARQAMENTIGEASNKIIWFKKTMEENVKFYYPMDIELRIINLAKAGAEEEVRDLLNDVYNENFFKKQLTSDMTKQLLYEIRGTIIKIINQSNIGNDELPKGFTNVIDQLYHCSNIDEVYANIHKMNSLISNIINERKKSHNTKLKDEILKYINENYTSSSFCLCMISSKFDLTEAYTSQFFKEQTGESFSVYLERVRIQLANELLCKTDHCIDDISKIVGYNSSHSFRRAYKRVTGVIPTACREID